MSRVVLVMFLLFVASCSLATMPLGCAAAKPAEADLLYGTQQATCVDLGESRAAIDACRARVRAAWAADAGGDQ